jgi:hypothetical protein
VGRLHDGRAFAFGLDRLGREPFSCLLVDPRGCYSNSLRDLVVQLQGLIGD